MAYQNFYATKLQNSIGSSDTSFDVQTPPTVTNGRLVLEPRNAQLREIISFTGVAGTTLTGVTRGLYGTAASPHNSGVLVEMNYLAEDYQDLVDAFDTFSATNGGGWYDLASVPTLEATNGNRSFDIAIPGDKTGILSKGMRLKIPRTVTAPTQSTDLNGTTQYASKSSPTGLSFTDDFTMEAWIKPESLGSRMGIAARRNADVEGWSFQIDPEGQLELLGLRIAANNRYISTNQSVPLNRWTHVAATLDMSGNTGTCYIDGVAVSTFMTTNGTATALVQGTTALVIGAEKSAGTNPFNGKIADVRLWSSIRTQAQIRNNMNQQLTGSETNLLGYWKLNGNFNDSTANANNLTAVGSAVATNVDNPFNANTFTIITSDPVYDGSTETTMTVQTPEGYPIPNETLGTASYSAVRNPYDFPTEVRKWQIAMGFGDQAKTSAFSATFANYNSLSFNLPVGEWEICGRGSLFIRATGTTSNLAHLGFSTSTTVPDLEGLTTRFGQGHGTSATQTMYQDVNFQGVKELAAATTFYVIYAFSTAGTGTNFDWGVVSGGVPSAMTADFGLL